MALAASDGFLTTRIACGLYSNLWLITPDGLSHYFLLIGHDGDDE